MIYIDNAATTFPKPESVSREVNRCLTSYCGNPGRGSHKMSLMASDAIFEAREKLTALVGVGDPTRCIFTLNTTYALNIALKSLVKPGSHILISDMEHNSVYRQVVKLNHDGIASYNIFSTYRGNDDKMLCDIKRKIRNNTTVLICQISSNISSLSMPVYRIGNLCRSKEIFFIADAAQSAGIINIDVDSMNIDALCVPSHKGLYGPQGAGAVIFSKRVSPLLRSFIEGGSGSDSLNPYMPDILPDKFEAGTMPTPAIAGLSKGIDFVKSYGIENISRHESSISNYLFDELMSDKRYTVYGDDANSGIVLFNVKGHSSTEVSQELDKHGICVRSGFHCAPLAHKTLKTGQSGAVRASFGVFNGISDAKILLDALYRITK